MPSATPSSPRSGRPAPFVPVVPAGGSGSRLWPLSRRDRPKFLLDLTGTGRSLLQQTLDRVLPLADRPPLVVTGRAHEAAVREQLGEGVRVLAEPSPRSSMPAIALAAAVVVTDDEDAVIGSFAADHLIGDTEAFARAVHAARAAAERGYLVTLGVRPDRPATGFGYIEEGDEARTVGGDLTGTGAVPVRRFVEKPGPELAARFLDSGRFRWNAGMFVVRARVLLDALAEQIPALAAGATEIAAARGTDAEQAVMERVWPTLTTIAIDHALAEPLAALGRVAMVPAAFDWDDVGDFAALARQLRAARGTGASAPRGDGAGDVIALGGAETVAVDARATVYGAPGRLVALVGLDGVSVVATDDVLLVVGDDRAQEVAELGPVLDRRGRDDLR